MKHNLEKRLDGLERQAEPVNFKLMSGVYKILKK